MYAQYGEKAWSNMKRIKATPYAIQEYERRRAANQAKYDKLNIESQPSTFWYDEMTPYRIYRHVSFKFLDLLFKTHQTGQFTCQDAYELYQTYLWMQRTAQDRTHVQRYGITELDEWGKMNARNTLCYGARLGILERVARGTYRFSPDVIVYPPGSEIPELLIPELEVED